MFVSVAATTIYEIIVHYYRLTTVQNQITKPMPIDVNKRLGYKFSSLSTHPTASSAIVVLYRGTTNALCAPQKWLSSVLN